MIAIDTSSLVAFLRGDKGSDVEAVDQALELSQAVLPPVVLTEVLSLPRLDRRVSRLIRELPVLEVQPGFWERAGAIRARLLAKRRRARLADALISQSCIDHRVPLITRDRDFRHFAKLADLKLIG
jgi:predicted nucleic acid-binding protein